MNKDIDVKWVSINELKPHPDNPNTHSDEQIQTLANILKYQGFRSPLVVSNRSGYITVGHGRLEAAKLNKWTKVPVSYQDYDDYDQEYSHIVSDNAIADWAHLDLAKINAELEKLGPMDIELLGIKDFEIEPLDKFDEPNEKKEPTDKEGELNTCPNCGCAF